MAGPENGRNGFELTFTITYVRDFCLKYNCLGESFETAVPWDKIPKLVECVTKRIEDECKKEGCSKKPFISFRIT